MIITVTLGTCGLSTVSELDGQPTHRFLFKYNLLDNLLCKVCQLQWQCLLGLSILF